MRSPKDPLTNLGYLLRLFTLTMVLQVFAYGYSFMKRWWIVRSRVRLGEVEAGTADGSGFVE